MKVKTVRPSMSGGYSCNFCDSLPPPDAGIKLHLKLIFPNTTSDGYGASWDAHGQLEGCCIKAWHQPLEYQRSKSTRSIEGIMHMLGHKNCAVHVAAEPARSILKRWL
eukprot:609045-Pelagomonas_calceolata.AAC.2